MNKTAQPNFDSMLASSQLGKTTEYQSKYSPGLLFPIPRALKRSKIGVTTPLPFHGFDLWRAIELSWINPKGRPIVAIGEFEIPCTSTNIVESKSIKLYLNSFNNTIFEDAAEIKGIIEKDLTKAADAPITATIDILSKINNAQIQSPEGVCLDYLDITTNQYTVDPSLLKTTNETVTESVYSDLLKSNCPCTNQPDWGTVQIYYQGKKIHHESLLKYIISYRDHMGFHEQCVEQIFMDITRICKPEKLAVQANYTRRGGLDINPFRASHPDIKPTHKRFIRQ